MKISKQACFSNQKGNVNLLSFCFSTERKGVLELPMSAAEDPAQGRNSSNSAELDKQNAVPHHPSSIFFHEKWLEKVLYPNI